MEVEKLKSHMVGTVAGSTGKGAGGNGDKVGQVINVGKGVGFIVGIWVSLGESDNDGDWLGRNRHDSPIDTLELFVVPISVLPRNNLKPLVPISIILKR